MSQSQPTRSLADAFSSAALSIVPSSSSYSSNGGGRPSSSCVVPATLESDPSSGGGAGASNLLTSNAYQTTAFYADTSGRARVRLTLRLDCASAEDVDVIAGSGCVVPAPVSVVGEGGDDDGTGEEKERDNDDNDDDDGDGGGGEEKSSSTKSVIRHKTGASCGASLRFECSPVPAAGDTGQSVAVEAVTILSTHLDKSDPDDAAVLFRAEVSVRATEHGQPAAQQRRRRQDDPAGPETDGGNAMIPEESSWDGAGKDDGKGEAFAPAVLELWAVLSERVTNDAATTTTGQRTGKRSGRRSKAVAEAASSVSLGLLALELGGGIAPPPPPSLLPPSSAAAAAADPSSFQRQQQMPRQHYSTRHHATPPATLHLRIVEPLTVTVREVGGARAAMGATLVSVTVAHSDLHDEDVAVSNLALHPGHSRLWGQPPPNQGQQGQRGGEQYQNQYYQQQQGARAVQADALPASDDPIRPSGSRSANLSIRAGTRSGVIDMSRQVRWGYAPGTAPSLPLVLRPREAFATVLQVDAGENLRSRTFVSPVAVTAVVGGGRKKREEEEKEGEEKKGDEDASARDVLDAHPPPSPVVVAADARWTTARLAVEPADAFRVDMSLLGDGRCKVGAPVVVGLRVMNLSNETRDLMLLMAKDEESNRDKDGGLGTPRSGGGAGGGGFGFRRVGRGGAAAGGGGSPLQRQQAQAKQQQQQQPQQHHGVNTAVVSEVNGYTFGVWGLSGDDDGTTRHNRDHELLAVDAALLLGEVKGQHTIEAELRFVPLREGTLDVPNLKLYDKLGGRWYNCVHLLKIVAAAK